MDRRDDTRHTHSTDKGSKSPVKRENGSKQVIFRRTIFLMVLCGVVTFIPLVKTLWELSIVEHEKYSQIATNQQTKDVSVTADRGAITDRNGEILAMSATVYQLILSPLDVAARVPESKYTEDKVLDEAAYAAAVTARENAIIDGVTAILGVSREKMENHMSRTDSQYEIIKKNIEKDEADALRELMLELDCGYDLYLTPDSKRYYPHSDLASHVVGFVNSQGGAYGIEAVFEDTLKGEAGRVVTTKTGVGTEMYNSFADYVDAEDGYNVNLTIDTTIQYYAEKALAEGIEAFDVLFGGFCIVMNPKTGEILAMASSPDYDLNGYSTVQDDILLEQIAADTQTYYTSFQADPAYKDKSLEEIMTAAGQRAMSDAQNRQWRSQAINDTYEPGSTFKALLLAAALEEGVVDENDTYYCSGYLRVAGRDIYCSDRKGHKDQTLEKAIQNSCNPAVMEIAQAMGADMFYDYFEAFGMADYSTGIELVGEGTGAVWSRELLNSPEGRQSLATGSFGQRFTITPLQMINGFAATINGGNLLSPYVVASLTDDDGTVVQRTQTEVVRQVISEETSNQTREILESVVSEGTGGKAYVPGYRIGGKTGTSETLIDGEVVVSFMGFAPADDPEILVLLGYNTPNRKAEGSNYSTTDVYISGGNMAAPKAGPLIADILDYMGIEKEYTTEEAATADAQAPSLVGATLDTAKTKLKGAGFAQRVVGEGQTITAQIPMAGATIPRGSTVILYTDGALPPTESTVPNVAGLDYESTKRKLEQAGLFMRASGSNTGYGVNTKAISQSVVSGEMTAMGTVVDIVFSSPVVVDGYVLGD